MLFLMASSRRGRIELKKISFLFLVSLSVYSRDEGGEGWLLNATA